MPTKGNDDDSNNNNCITNWETRRARSRTIYPNIYYLQYVSVKVVEILVSCTGIHSFGVHVFGLMFIFPYFSFFFFFNQLSLLFSSLFWSHSSFVCPCRKSMLRPLLFAPNGSFFTLEPSTKNARAKLCWIAFTLQLCFVPVKRIYKRLSACCWALTGKYPSFLRMYAFSFGEKTQVHVFGVILYRIKIKQKNKKK